MELNIICFLHSLNHSILSGQVICRFLYSYYYHKEATIVREKKVLFQFILLGMLIVFVILFRNNPFVLNGQPYNNAGEPIIENEQLRQDIETRSEEYKEDPVDAYIDRIWKKTPGRNGLRVNIDKSYDKMKKMGVFDESLIVYDQVAPQVTLSDLPASPIYRGHPEKEMVALMINVSWG